MEQEHLAQTKHDESMLLTGQVCTLNDAMEEPGLVAKQSIFFDESRAQVHLGCEGADTEQRWYLDSGASSHMSVNKEATVELDGGIVGSGSLAMAQRSTSAGAGSSSSSA